MFRTNSDCYSSGNKVGNSEESNLSNTSITQAQRNVNPAYLYTEGNIDCYVNTVLRHGLNGFKKVEGAEDTEFSFLLNKKFGTGNDAYYVAYSGAIDSASKVPLDFFFDKTKQPAPDEGKPDDRKDILDELLPVILLQEDCKAKILFPYNITNSHWLTGEICLTKKGDEVTVVVQTHNPYGGGKLSNENFTVISEAFKKGIENRGLTFKGATNSESEFITPRQLSNDWGNGDVTSCGVIVADEIIKRIEDIELNLLQPHSVGAIDLREGQLQYLKEKLGNNSQQFVAFEQDVTTTACSNQSSTNKSGNLKKETTSQKTIFDYDSSDDEEAKQVKKDMYGYGTAILNHQIISKAYKAEKAALFKAPAEHAKAITAALTMRGKATKKEEKVVAEEFFLHLGTPRVDSDKIKNARSLYENLLNIQAKHKEEDDTRGLIDTHDFKCFMVLKDFLADRVGLVDSDLQDAWGIRKGQVQLFLNEVLLILNITEEINKLLEFKNALPGVARDKFLAIIVGSGENLAMALQSFSGIINVHDDVRTDLELLEKSKEFYEAAAEIQKKYKGTAINGVIDSVNLKCFHTLKSSIAKEDDLTPLEKSWGLQKNTGSKFLNEVKEKANCTSIISNFIDFMDQKSLVTQKKIRDYLVEDSTISNIELCMISMFYDQEKHLSGILTRLSEFDRIVNDAIKELKFFAGAEQPTAEGFLVSGLLYQKYLKTITKFSAFREYGKKIASKINVFNRIDIDTTNSFSTGLKRTEQVIGFDVYTDAKDSLVSAQLALRLGNEELVGCFKSILRGKNLFEAYHNNFDAVKILYDITYLLFSSEANRNPSALISNAIFFELVKAGKYTIEKDMVSKMPMAMVGAIQVGRYYHDNTQERCKKVNDYGDGKAPEKDLTEFKKREEEILKQYNALGRDGGIEALVKDWYGIDLDPTHKGGPNLDKLDSMIGVSSAFYEYTMQGLNELLRLRIENAELKDTLVLPDRYVFSEEQNNVKDLLSAVTANISNKQNNKEVILAPISLNNKHAVGLMFVRQVVEDSKSGGHIHEESTGRIAVYYIDPSNDPIPSGLKEILHRNGYMVEQLPAEEQKYTNCGPEVIDNFMLYLTGERLSQEDAVRFNSWLFENELLREEGRPNYGDSEDQGHTRDELVERECNHIKHLEKLEIVVVDREAEAESTNVMEETSLVATRTDPVEQGLIPTSSEVLTEERLKVNREEVQSSIIEAISEQGEVLATSSLNAEQQPSEELMDEVWEDVHNFNANELDQCLAVTKQEEEDSKAELESMDAVWSQSQVYGTYSMLKLPKITDPKEVVKDASTLATQSSDRPIEQQPVELKKSQSHIGQQTQVAPSYEAPKVFTGMGETLWKSAIQCLRMAMYVDSYEVPDVMRSALHTGGCAVPSRSDYSPELREILSQNQSANRYEATKQPFLLSFSNFLDESQSDGKRNAASVELKPLDNTLSDIPLGACSMAGTNISGESWLQQFEMKEVDLLGKEGVS